MTKSNYLKTWKDARNQLQQAVKNAKPAPNTVKLVGDLLKKASEMEKALEGFDSAVNKGHRKDAALYYQKVWKTCAEFPFAVHAAQKQLSDDDPLLGELQMLPVAVSRITSAAPATLKEVQEAKGKAIEVAAFLADFEQEKAKFEKAAKANKQAAQFEKDYKVSALGIASCLKPLKEYTVAAGRADVAKASNALKDFTAKCKNFETNYKKVYDLISGDKLSGGYPAALKQLLDFAKSLREGRVKGMIDKLTAIAAG